MVASIFRIQSALNFTLIIILICSHHFQTRELYTFSDDL
jgi:hypothetical protein